MAAGRFVVPPYFPARDRDFKLLAGALLYVYENETTTKASIYTDEALTVLSSNPVVANSSGQFPAVYAEAGTEDSPGLYSVAITTSTGASPGNPFIFDNYRPSVDWETAAAALAEAAALLAEAEAAAAAASADAAEADAIIAAAVLAAIEAIIAGAPEAPSILNKLNRNGDNAQPGLLAAIGEQYPDLTDIPSVVDSDVLALYRTPGPLKRTTATIFADYLGGELSGNGTIPSVASRASLADETIKAAIKQIATRGYAAEGDGGGWNSAVRTSYATIVSGGYPAASYQRSLDRFMPDGSTDATNGGYWLLSDAIVNPYQFGALPDNGTAYTTEWQAAVSFGKPLVQSSGTWKFGPITPPADAQIDLTGSTVIPDFVAGGQEKLFNLTNPRVTITGLTIDGLAGTITETKFLIFVQAADCYLSDITFTNITMSDGNLGLTNLKMVQGIYFNPGCDRCIVERYRVNVLSGPAFFTKESNDFTLDKFWLTDTGWYSVNIDYDCAGFTIRNGVIDGDDLNARNWGGSINLMSQTTGSPNRRALVDNIYIKGVHNYGAALRLLSCSDLNVTNIWIEDCIGGSLLAGPVQYMTIDRRGVSTALPNGGPMSRVSISAIKMRAKGQSQAIYMKNQHLTARDPHTDILIDDVVLDSPNTTDFFENALWINGYSGGFKTLTVTNLRGTVKTITGSVQGGAIGVVASDNEGRISDLKIDAQLRDIGTIDYAATYQMGFYLTNYVNRASVTGSFENFRYGGRTGSTGLTGLQGMYDCQYVNCLDPLLLSVLPSVAAKPLSMTAVPTSGILYTGQRILNPTAAPSASPGWQITTAGPAADGIWLTATVYAVGIWKRNASNRVYELMVAGGGATSVEPTGTTVGATETGADGYTWRCRGTAHQRLCTLAVLSAVIPIP